MFLLYTFPSRFTLAADAFTGAVDGISWVTGEGAGEEGLPVPAGAAAFVRGWATNLEMTRPATCVVLVLDDVWKTFARIGGGRPDVAAHFGSDELMASGFEGVFTTGNLAPGEHEVVAYTVDEPSKRYARIAQSLRFAVEADWLTPPKLPTIPSRGVGNIDGVDDEASKVPLSLIDGVVYVSRGRSIKLHGWFFDAEQAPLGPAYAIVDRERAYDIRYGGERPDVSDNLGRADARSSGFSVSLSTAGLSPGTHRIEIAAVGRTGDLVVLPLSLNVAVGDALTVRYPLDDMAPAFLDDVTRVPIGLPSTGEGPLRVARGDKIFVRGWAYDGVENAPAAGVVLVVDDRLEIPSLYGLARPDVAAAHQNPAIVRSGFTAQIETERLDAGYHTVAARVLSKRGLGAYATAQRFDFEVSES